MTGCRCLLRSGSRDVVLGLNNNTSDRLIRVFSTDGRYQTQVRDQRRANLATRLRGATESPERSRARDLPVARDPIVWKRGNPASTAVHWSQQTSPCGSAQRTPLSHNLHTAFLFHRCSQHLRFHHRHLLIMTMQIDELLFDPELIPAAVQESVGNDIEVMVPPPQHSSSADCGRRSVPWLQLMTRAATLNCSQSSPMPPHALAKSINVSSQVHPMLIISSFRCHEGLHWLLLHDCLRGEEVGQGGRIFHARKLIMQQLVAVGTVFVERKFTRGLGVVGHIEDIAVSKSMQGRKLGLYLIKSLEEIARTQGCYKVILDCSTANIRGSHIDMQRVPLTISAFYEKCGCVPKRMRRRVS